MDKSYILSVFPDENTYYWYWFVNMKGIGSITQKSLLDRFSHPKNIYQLSSYELRDILSRQQLENFDASRKIKWHMETYKQLKAFQGRFIHWESEDYPEPMRRLFDAPYGLYLKGRLPDFTKPILSIVGARAATQYGIRIAENYAFQMAKAGIQIVSGLAAGIDAAAHGGALRAKGYTMGILGGGIDTMYPKYNFHLYMDMYEKGGVLSEHNMGVKNAAGLFPVRNRLISCVADGIFVVEARKKSGSLITADQGLEQGKEVFALPGRVSDPLSEGCNNLIAEGATIVQSVDEIIETVMERHYAGVEYIRQDYVRENGVKVCDTYEENIVYKQLDYVEPVSFNQLLSRSGLSMQELMHTLFSMELKQIIYQPQQNVFLLAVH